MAAGTNVMPITTRVAQSGKGRQVSGENGGASPRTPGRGRGASQRSGKFGDVLEQSQDVVDSRKDMMGAVDEAAELPKDPIAAAIAVTSQSSQPDTADTPEESGAAETVVQNMLSASMEETVPGTEKQVMPWMSGVTSETFTKDAVPAANLQTLLPQSDEMVRKGKNMLDVLSGRGWKQIGGQSNNQAVGLETETQTADRPSDSVAGGTRFMGIFRNSSMDVPHAKTVDLPQTQVMWNTQDVKGVSNQQTQQLALSEDSQQMQQGIQQDRPQAQPGMQGMPVMQNAQAPLTRSMQNESVSQNLQDEKNPTDIRNMTASEEPLRPLTNKSLSQVSAPKQMAAGMTKSLHDDRISDEASFVTDGDGVTDTKDFAIPRDRIQRIDRRQEVLGFTPIEKISVQESALEDVKIASEKVLEEVSTSTTVATEPHRWRMEPRNETQAFGGNVNGNRTGDEQHVDPVRQMMNGQEQPENRDQQSGERRPILGHPMAVQNDEVDKNPGRNRIEVRQQAELQQQPEAALQQNPQHNQTAGFQQTLNTVQTQATGPAQPQTVPGQEFDIPGQIVEQARLIRNPGNTEMVMHLKPEHLGDLTLRISVSEHGAVTASFHSDNAQVRAIIENSLVQLRQELSNQGIKVDNVEVYAGLSDDGLLNGQGQQAWQQNQQDGSRRNRSFDMEAFEDESAELSAVSDVDGAEEGVDYRV